MNDRENEMGQLPRLVLLEPKSAGLFSAARGSTGLFLILCVNEVTSEIQSFKQNTSSGNTFTFIHTVKVCWDLLGKLSNKKTTVTLALAPSSAQHSQSRIALCQKSHDRRYLH